MELDKIKVYIKGLSPLLMHNGDLANPLNRFHKTLKSLNSKKGKTEEDLLKIIGIQWEGSLYFNDSHGLHLPSQNIFAPLYKAAKKHKLGTKIIALTLLDPIGYSLKIDGDAKSLEYLKSQEKYKFVNMVKVNKSKVLAARAQFPVWSFDFDLEFDREIIDIEEIMTILKTFAYRIGLGAWTLSSPTPGQFGRFLLEKVELIAANSGKSKVLLEI